jgi:putative tryptophan/tyrosine transport system substrate-binding protein
MPAVETAASSRGVRAMAVQLGAAPDIEIAITNVARESNGGLILPTDTFTSLHQKQIVELADRHRLPAISWNPVFARVGGLMSYSVAITTLQQFRQAAFYVDQILKGAKPADLPVQQPVKFELAVNLKTAKALGLEVPPTLIARADEVIE